MNTLTKREKVLVYILLCVVIIICGTFLFVLPAIEKHSQLNSEYQQIQIKLAQTKSKVPDYTNLKKNIKTVQKDLKNIKAKYYGNLKKEDIDKEITGIAIKNGLTPVSLNIEASKEEEVLSYAEFIKKQASIKKEKATNKEPNSALMLKVYNVSLSVRGKVANVQKLVDEANRTKSMKISGVTYSNNNEKVTAITFKVFIIS